MPSDPHPFLSKLASNIKQKQSYLCIGLDPDPTKLPSQYPQTIHGIQSFLDDIVQKTLPFAIAFKPNISFFEALGIDGLRCLEQVVKRIPSHCPVILDAKRGDIGNTSRMQATFIYDFFRADATTLHPYMGLDSLKPFFDYKDKFNFVLALTSNPSATDFETLKQDNSTYVYQTIAKKCQDWNAISHNIGLVVGATHNTDLIQIRKETPHLLFLMPGVGSQGGSYQNAIKLGQNSSQMVIVNVSRSVLYAADPILACQEILTPTI